MAIRHWINLVLMISTSLAFIGCGTKTVELGTKIDELSEQNQAIAKLRINPQALNTAFIRTQSTELQNRFPLLPNPKIVLFIYPHLSRAGHPVPGYSTIFSLYAKDQYALPAEVY